MLAAVWPGVELLCIVFAASCVTEGLLWLWAYRLPSFTSLKAQVEKQARKQEKSNTLSYSKQKVKSKKVDRLELHLKNEVTRNLANLRLKQGLVMGGTLFVLFRQLSRRYDGVVMAKLPFEPFPFMRKMTQRGLENPAVNDCAFMFLYAILNMGIRGNIGKLLDIGPSRRMLDMAGLVSPMDKQQ